MYRVICIRSVTSFPGLGLLDDQLRAWLETGVDTRSPQLLALFTTRLLCHANRLLRATSLFGRGKLVGRVWITITIVGICASDVLFRVLVPIPRLLLSGNIVSLRGYFCGTFWTLVVGRLLLKVLALGGRGL